MQIPSQADFVRQIDEFLLRHDMKPSRLAREATGEPGLIDAIREGKRSPTLATVEKIAVYMERKDSDARLKARELELAGEPIKEEDPPLPFSTAPVNPTGASSATCSSTTAHPTSSAASGSSPICSCSADPSHERGTFAGPEAETAQ